MSNTLKNNLNKSRYGRISTKRKFNEEFMGESSRTISSHSRLSQSVSNKNLNVHSSKANELGIGDMVWAKTGKYPLWPGIIISDPESNQFSKRENNVSMLHIYYCNDAYKRNWIRVNQVFEFCSKLKILTEYPKLLTQISRSKLKIKWNKAVDDAESLATMKKDRRISTFFTNNLLPRINLQLLNATQIDKLKICPKDHETLKNITKKAKVSTTNHKEEQKTETFNQHLPDIVLPKSEFNDNQNEINQPKPLSVLNLPKDHPRILIPELCKQFYTNGWVTGTGGGISIKYKNNIFIAPSGVQKERIEPEDIYSQDMNGVDIEVPSKERHLTKSQCTPIFMCSYIERNAGAVIHTHSLSVVQLCLLNPENELRISGFEMIKGIYNEKNAKFYDNDEEVVIPIIENSKYEKDLVDTFKMALINYPSTSAILVRNHGMYVWGKDWKTAKTQCECYEYIFKLMVFKKVNNI